MDFAPSPRGAEMLERVTNFITDEILPAEPAYRDENVALNDCRSYTYWQVPPTMDALKAKARDAGLWNLFLPDAKLGAGLSVSDYALVAEAMGRCLISAEVFNCSAPDTGNMDVLYHFGTAEQKARWLTALLAGEIRSVFCMTEPEVASSDAINMAATITEDGDEVVIEGRKWWSTGIGHPRARLAIVMGRSASDGPAHQQHSMVLVPLDAPGVQIERMLPTFGELDPPYGHGEVTFHQVRVPKANLIGGLGMGFMIAQGRLGPGRIHHCMRAIGAAEKALELAIKRGLSRQAFGRPLLKLGGNADRIGDLRVMIDQARLLTLHAAWKIDSAGVRAAMSDISAIKLVAPTMLQTVVDFAIQIHGGLGLTRDTPLTELYIMARALRFADGPDEVHRATLARREIRKYTVARGA